ncbi:MAG: trypsin-like peptidase domain-containing protein [Planctomycetota bacterium]
METNRNRRGSRVSTFFALLLFAAAVILIWERFVGPADALHDSTSQPRPVVARGDLLDFEQATIEIYRAVSPSVVHVTNLVTGRNRLTMDIMAIPQGSGSGFFWDEKGYVVTNYHVVARGEAFQVALSDQTTYPAMLVGTAPHKDLAVLKIQAPPEQLRPLALGTSSDLQVGQQVFAIGNPFGLDQTLTTGIISGLDREVRSPLDIPIPGVIQTDAAINPGNSGGPLLDSRGLLIGVNTAIYSKTGDYAGIGFAVPVDTVNRIVPEIIRTGRAGRAGLGVKTVADQIRARLGFERGALIGEVSPDSPAERAGLRPSYRTSRGVVVGDLIVGVDGKPVDNIDALHSILASYDVGDTVEVELERDREIVRKRIELEDIDR